MFDWDLQDLHASDDQADPNRRRKGEWALTASGRQFWPGDPRIDDIDIEDIAHHLSLQCRFAGASKYHYSVAQHSVLVASICSSRNKLVGLLHDASEAYVQDIIRATKALLADVYKPLEVAWSGAIGLVFGLGERLVHQPDEVKNADRMLLVAERYALLPRREWPAEPMYGGPIEQWSPERARAEFLSAYSMYEAAR